MELKYKTSDVQNLVDIFADLAKKKSIKEVTADDIKKLSAYPLDVVEVFLETMQWIAEKHSDEDNYIRENYWGIVGYICMRMNFAKPKLRMDF